VKGVLSIPPTFHPKSKVKNVSSVHNNDQAPDVSENKSTSAHNSTSEKAEKNAAATVKTATSKTKTLVCWLNPYFQNTIRENL
jgi:esterase/lipase superfamily enzyme